MHKSAADTILNGGAVWRKRGKVNSDKVFLVGKRVPHRSLLLEYAVVHVVKSLRICYADSIGEGEMWACFLIILPVAIMFNVMQPEQPQVSSGDMKPVHATIVGAPLTVAEQQEIDGFAQKWMMQGLEAKKVKTLLVTMQPSARR